MATLDVNKMIQESISSAFSNTSPSSGENSYLESVISEIKKNPNITSEIVEDAFPEIFENEETLAKFIEMLESEDIKIIGINKEAPSDSSTEDNINENTNHISADKLSTAIGLITIGLSARKYLNQ